VTGPCWTIAIIWDPGSVIDLCWVDCHGASVERGSQMHVNILRLVKEFLGVMAGVQGIQVCCRIGSGIIIA